MLITWGLDLTSIRHDVALAQSMIARLQKTRAPAAAAGAAAPTPGAASAAANAAATSAAATGGPKPATIDKMQLALPERVTGHLDLAVFTHVTSGRARSGTDEKDRGRGL